MKYGSTSRERPKSASYLRLKNIQETTVGKTWKFFFKKKYLVKKVAYCRKTQKETENFEKNSRGYPLIEFKNFGKMSEKETAKG